MRHENVGAVHTHTHTHTCISLKEEKSVDNIYSKNDVSEKLNTLRHENVDAVHTHTHTHTHVLA